jgi:hypothetical protein
MTARPSSRPRTARALDASGAQVVVLARAGQDLGRWGQPWSHLGLAYRDAAAGGAWRVVHKLNRCGSDRASVYRQGLGDFFLDDPFELAAAWAVPDATLQRGLLAVLGDTARIARLHEPAYSMVAYPWAARYQQSNQWVIETMAFAADPAASSRERAQAWLRLRGYEPAVLRIDAFTRLGARVGSANVAFDDHPDTRRYAGRIETVTADSVFAWMGPGRPGRRADGAALTRPRRPQGACRSHERARPPILDDVRRAGRADGLHPAPVADRIHRRTPA